MRLSDDDLAREYRSFSDAEIREHYEASRDEAMVQFRIGDRYTAQAAQRCRQSAERYSREMVRRAKERGSR